jgi:hypothetical protein
VRDLLVIGCDNTLTVVVAKEDTAGETTWEGADEEVYIIEKNHVIKNGLIH